MQGRKLWYIHLSVLPSACGKNRQGIRYLLVHLLIAAVPTVQLMENNAVFDEKDPSCMAGRPCTVRHHKNGLAAFIHVFKNTEQTVRSPGIQGARRFVRKQNLRLRNKRSGNCRPLLLPS